MEVFRLRQPSTLLAVDSIIHSVLQSMEAEMSSLLTGVIVVTAPFMKY